MNVPILSNEILYKILEFSLVEQKPSKNLEEKTIQVFSSVNKFFKSSCEKILATHYSKTLNNIYSYSQVFNKPLVNLKFNLENKEEFEFIVSNFKELRKLKLIEQSECNVLSIHREIKKLKNLKYLEKLSIIPTAYFNDECVAVLAKSCSKLRSLTIKNKDITSASFIEFHKLPQLERLNLENCALSDFNSLAEIKSTFPNIKELNLKGVGFSDGEDFILDFRPLIENLEKLFPNLETLILDRGSWGTHEEFLSLEDFKGIERNYSATPFDSFPFLPKLRKFDLLNHYLIGLESIGKVKNLHGITDLSIQCPLIENQTFGYWADETDRENSFRTLLNFKNLQKLKLSFVSDRFLESSTSCNYLPLLKEHPSLKEFTAYFGSFNYRQLEQIFNVAEGVDTIILEASEFIFDPNHVCSSNENVKTLRIDNSNIHAIQNEYLEERHAFDEIILMHLEENQFLENLEMGLDEVSFADIERALYEDPMELIETFNVSQTFGEIDSQNEIIDIDREIKRRKIIDRKLLQNYESKHFGYKYLFYGENVNLDYDVPPIFRRVGTSTKFFHFSKFAPYLEELVLSCPEEELEINAFDEIIKLHSLKKLVLGFGTSSQSTYYGSEINDRLGKYCSEIPRDTSRVKRACLGKRQPESFSPPDPKKRRL